MLGLSSTTSPAADPRGSEGHRDSVPTSRFRQCRWIPAPEGQHRRGLFETSLFLPGSGPRGSASIHERKYICFSLTLSSHLQKPATLPMLRFRQPQIWLQDSARSRCCTHISPSPSALGANLTLETNSPAAALLGYSRGWKDYACKCSRLFPQLVKTPHP